MVVLERDQMVEHRDIFMCPACGGDLTVDSEIECQKCRTRYQVEDGIPLMFHPHNWQGSGKDVTDRIKAFYEKTPFPNYEEFENVGDLIQKAERGLFANFLNKQIPFNTRVLEVGCGTGQLTNYLGVAHRSVFGTDMCLNSLKLAQNFKQKNNLERAGFYQMNLFRPIFKEESFHLVICNGVLHHTGDPFAGFQSISKLVKKEGYILIGLYNRYGRLITDARRVVFRAFGDRFQFLDPRLRGQDRGEAKRLAWFTDQYHNPHESKHTIGEVLKWFDQTGFDFVSGIPSPKAFEGFIQLEDCLFKPHLCGNGLDHFIVQLNLLLLHGSREGGLFMMIGKRRR